MLAIISSPASGASLTIERVAELRRHCATLVRRSILTLAADPDRDQRFQHSPKSCLPQPVRDAQESYGYGSARAGRFRPTPQDLSHYLDVLGWLTWLSHENDGQRDVKVLVARAWDVPWWRLAQRFGRSDDTMRRWEKNAIDRLTLQYWREIDRLT